METNTTNTTAGQDTTAAPAAWPTPRPAAQVEAERRMVDALARFHLAEGKAPMDGDDALMLVAQGHMTPREALLARGWALSVERRMAELQAEAAGRPAPHIWHSINGLELDLAADGRLEICAATGQGGEGAITLTPQAALGLMMFFTFPNVDRTIIEADAANQARAEARLAEAAQPAGK